jgi:RND family efflux transporter MFP subunit
MAVVVAAVAIGVRTLAGLAGPPVPTMTVAAAPFRVRVVAEGNLSAVRSTPLAAPMKPRMAFTLAWLVDDGALVEEGDIVARFDASQLEKDREDGLSDRRISEHRISSAKTSQDVTIGNLDRDAEVAEEELEVAREFQTTDDLGYSKMEIIESQIDTELAETRADHARQSQQIQDELSDTENELLAIDRRKAEIRVQQAVDGLAALEVTAPHSGIVMLERDWRGNPVRVGDMVWPGRPLGSIPDLDEMQAEVFVLEADAGNLSAGQKATVWIEASPGVEHSAKVKSVDPMAGRRNRQVPVQYFRTVLELEHTDRETMKPGSRVRSEIILADLENAVTVPRQAVCSLDGATVVYRWRRGGFEPVEIELGPAALGRVVIESGLEEGDVIALRDPTAVDDTARSDGVKQSAPDLTGGPG